MAERASDLPGWNWEHIGAVRQGAQGYLLHTSEQQKRTLLGCVLFLCYQAK